MIYVKIPLNEYELPVNCVECKHRVYDDDIVWREHGKTQFGGHVCIFSKQLINNCQREESCPLEDDGKSYKSL